MDFKKLRQEMVRRQIASRGITDCRLLEVMGEIPREKFVEEQFRASAYEDHPLPIGADQTISQPYIVGLMTECLQLKGEERVLEIGCGSGYQAAILARLCKEVYTVDRIEMLVKRAEETIKELGHENVNFFVADGSLGLPQFSPYDRIIVTAAAPEPPSPLFQQLIEGGIMVVPVGERFSQELVVITKIKGKPHMRSAGGCVFVPLIGKYGWNDAQE